MKEQFLFVAAPYLAAGVFLSAFAVRSMSRARSERAVPASGATDGRIAELWAWAIGVVAAGHLVAFAFPDLILRWNRQPFRLLLLEGSGLCAGTLAFITFVWSRARRAASRPRDVVRPRRVLASTLMCIALGSGVGMAAIDRWGSSWSVVTLGPYLVSLLRLAPSTATVQGLPFLARVHLVGALALMAIWPFRGEAGFIATAIEGLMCRAGARSADVLGRASSVAAGWTVSRAEPLAALLFPDDAEDN